MTASATAAKSQFGNPAQEVRRAIRNGDRSHTGGKAPGYVQTNLTILPKEYALEFQTFCLLNPKPCPLLAVGDIGNPYLPTLGEDIDVRTDLSGYRIFENGEEVDVTDDISAYWRDDLVAFPLGCSYSFEEALVQDGVRVRHLEHQERIATYVTNIDTNPAGRFHGKMVVSMRPMNAADAIRSVQITSRFPNVHGAPIHIGHPEAIGIEDLNHQEFNGAPPRMEEHDLPVFWACGVTPQMVMQATKPSFCITHLSGHMLVTDLKNTQLAVI
jgi:uncharacterized protein YcsI (UPF0317 family)